MKTGNMIKTLILTVGIFLTTTAISAQYSGEIIGIPVEDVSLQKNGALMTATMTFDLKELKLKGNKGVVITPYIVNENDSVALQSFGLYTRSQWYHYERTGHFPEETDQIIMKYSGRPDRMDYIRHTEWENWMKRAHVSIVARTYGCCNDEEKVDFLEFAPSFERKEYSPVYAYQIVPDILSVSAMAKVREISGRAYVDFPVNRTEIFPNFRNNTKELGKIISTIDSVKNDPDITVTSITIKGTASPEGPYENNVRLAKGRTESLKLYVDKLYKFPKNFIRTSYKPVDWQGLAEYLTGPECTLANKEKILAIVESDLAPYSRNQKIKNDYPADYRYLLENVYPSLRHSDYKIEYEIKSFTSVEEIAERWNSSRDKLSVNEIIYLAQSYGEGTKEFNELFESALEMYPDNEQINLNVAVAALENGNIEKAEPLLKKAGNSPEADLARANLAFVMENYVEADRLLQRAAIKLPQAAEAYEIFKEADYLN
ncbi:MAG: DUF3868 domain-containing protein [Muribaculaceae bacterium]|nr:DUF3868 domain-containing protein [Muribaculaceae bacterium]